MAGASCRTVPLAFILVFFLACTAEIGTAELVGIKRALRVGIGVFVAPSGLRADLQLTQSPSASAFIAGVPRPLQQLQKHGFPPALAASAVSQAASCVGVGCRIVGVGSAVPETRITNDDLAQVVDTNDEDVPEMTQQISSFGVELGQRGNRMGGACVFVFSGSKRGPAFQLAECCGTAKDIDLVLHASSSPDDLFGDGPWLGAKIQTPGDPTPPAFDITAACSGFVVGLVTANMYLTSPGTPYQRALLVGSDALSRWLDWSDRNTCILFGDAAGAVVVAAPRAAPIGEQGKPLGLLSYVLHSDGSEHQHLKLCYKGSENRLPNKQAENGSLKLSRGCFSPLYMNGREVFKFVSRKVPGSLEAVLDAANLRARDVDWLLMHQANKRIIDAVAERLQIPQEKVLCNLEEYGNTSAASVPLCLNEAVRAGKIKKGDVIAMAGFGAGLTWAAAVLRYG